jgi:hypothetical protein
MGAIADLWKSERGLIAVVLVAAATVLTGLRDMTVDQWQNYTLWIFGLYAGGKTITGAVGMFTAAKNGAASADAPAATEAAPAPAAPAPAAPADAAPAAEPSK